jgi:hypothetical protein
MTTQYDNIKQYLNNNGFELLTSTETYVNDKNKNKYKKFTFRCNNNHTSEIAITSFNNKKSKITHIEELCSECVRLKNNEIKLKDLQSKILHNNHIILSYENNKNITYKCGNCNNINNTTSVNLLRPTSTKFCNKCQNDKNKLLYKDIKVRVEKMGMKLLLIETDYENNKQLLPIVCVCGKEYQLKLHDIERGRQCIFCKNGKNEQICREIFEKLTNKKFTNSRPKWLKGLELDGFNEELKIAWEYNGKQHYLYVPEFFHKNGIEEFYGQQERDKKKVQLCIDNNVKLLVIHYSLSKDLVKLETYIKNFLNEL